jgi:hypothetical protein
VQRRSVKKVRSTVRRNLATSVANNIAPEHVQDCMKTISAISAAVLLSSFAAGSADAAGPLQEGPLHWTARHVRHVAFVTRDTVSNVVRHRPRPVHRVFGD